MNTKPPSLQPHHDGECVKDIPLYAFGSHIARLVAANRTEAVATALRKSLLKP